MNLEKIGLTEIIEIKDNKTVIKWLQQKNLLANKFICGKCGKKYTEFVNILKSFFLVYEFSIMEY